MDKCLKVHSYLTSARTLSQELKNLQITQRCDGSHVDVAAASTWIQNHVDVAATSTWIFFTSTFLNVNVSPIHVDALFHVNAARSCVDAAEDNP
jgi:hypothetical protein